MRGGGAVLNPALLGAKEFIKDAIQKAKDKVKGSGDVGTNSSTPFYVKAVLFVIILGIIALTSWYLNLRSRLETPDNIRAYTDAYRKKADEIGSVSRNLSTRKSMFAYLDYLKTQQVPAEDWCLSNFYISTVNATGLFYPREDGIISPDAARLAVQAGARAFVFDIWPDLRPSANFSPILQVVEQGSLWRRITLNALPFHVILNTIISMIYGGMGGLNIQDGSRDCTIVYLRFRGVPRNETYTGVAAALRDAIEQYRLDSSFYARRGQDRLFSSPITHFGSKVVVVSNKTAEGTLLEDYINYLQTGPLPNINEWDARSIANLTIDMKNEKQAILMKKLTFSSPFPETNEAEINGWDWKKAHEIGIQYAGMNFFYAAPSLIDYMKPEHFGIYSYKIKPVELRYKILQSQPAQSIPDPGYGTGNFTQPNAVGLP